MDNKILFIGIEIVKNETKLETQVYIKPTNTGLLLHSHSHTDKRFKDSLLKTMIHRAHALSSTTEVFNAECAKLRSIFSCLDYAMGLIIFDSAINNLVLRNASANTAERNTAMIVAQLELVFHLKIKRLIMQFGSIHCSEFS